MWRGQGQQVTQDLVGSSWKCLDFRPCGYVVWGRDRKEEAGDKEEGFPCSSSMECWACSGLRQGEFGCPPQMIG